MVPNRKHALSIAGNTEKNYQRTSAGNFISIFQFIKAMRRSVASLIKQV
jgi:hypothetical protein